MADKTNSVKKVVSYLVNKAKNNPVANTYKAIKGANESQANLADTMTKRYLGSSKTDMGAMYEKAKQRTLDKIKKYGPGSNVTGMEKAGWGTYDKGIAGDGITPKNPEEYLKQQRKSVTGK